MHTHSQQWTGTEFAVKCVNQRQFENQFDIVDAHTQANILQSIAHMRTYQRWLNRRYTLRRYTKTYRVMFRC